MTYVCTYIDCPNSLDSSKNTPYNKFIQEHSCTCTTSDALYECVWCVRIDLRHSIAMRISLDEHKES